MPRARTGTLIPLGADGIWRARVTKTHANGSTTRPLYSLGTTDKALARRKLARLVALVEAGTDVLDAAETANAPERVKDYAQAWHGKRQAQGVVMARHEWRYLETHALPAIGKRPLCDVTAAHVRGVLEDFTASTYQRPNGPKRRYRQQTIAHVRAAMHRLFDAAWREGIIESNPVDRVRTPTLREVRKERAILTDDEFHAFIASPLVDLELRMLSLVARCEGGMRAGDLNRWDWTQIDRVHFAECIIPRANTRTPQALAIPGALAPFLRAWWERAGRPESGPVFPVRQGPRAGEVRATSGGFAKRLRRELFLAGIVRMLPVEAPATKPGTRTDLGKHAQGTQLAPNPRDPLYFETATTLPVDFHSFRRAFNTALAEAGVNVQHAMHLASHADTKTHMRYVMRTTAMRTIPDAALPILPSATFESSRPVTNRGSPDQKPEGFQRARRDSNPRHVASKATALSS